MIDGADKAAADEERAMELFERQRRGRTAMLLPGDRNCLDCGMRIPPARVAAVPHARRCCQCQAEVEAR